MRSAFGPPIGGPLQPQQPRCHLGVVCVVRPFGLVGMHHGAKKKARSWSVMLIPVFTPAALLGRGSFRSRCVVMATLNASSLDSDASSIANAPLTIAVGEPAQQYWSQIPADPTLYELQTGSALSFRFSTGHNLWLLPTEEAFSACDFSAATELASLTYGGGQPPLANDYRAVTTRAGELLFACAAAFGSHCGRGQKIKVIVSDPQSPVAPPALPPPAVPSSGSDTGLVVGLSIGAALLAALLGGLAVALCQRWRRRGCQRSSAIEGSMRPYPDRSVA